MLLIGGGSSHDFEKFFHKADAAILAKACTVAYTANLEEAVAQMPHADAVVISTNQPAFGTSAFQEALTRFADSGHGVVLLHPGVWYNWPPATGYNLRFAGGGARGHNALGPFEVKVTMPEHPVLHGIPATFPVVDELYHVTLDPAAHTTVLATAATEARPGETHPSVWTVDHPKARILCIALGHDERVHDLPAFQMLLNNAVQWVTGAAVMPAK